jgi:hypothetical protein
VWAQGLLTQSEGKDANKGLEADEEKGADEGNIFGAMRGPSKHGQRGCRQLCSRRGGVRAAVGVTHRLRRPRNGTGILAVLGGYWCLIDARLLSEQAVYGLIREGDIEQKNIARVMMALGWSTMSCPMWPAAVEMAWGGWPGMAREGETSRTPL